MVDGFIFHDRPRYPHRNSTAAAAAAYTYSGGGGVEGGGGSIHGWLFSFI